jgi:hypothetical protein
MSVSESNEAGASVLVSEAHVTRLHLMLLFISAAETSVSSPSCLDCGVRACIDVV